MKVNLTPGFELSDEHSASSYGIPVLVNTETQEAYGPGDTLQAFEHMMMPAAKAVEIMARRCKFTYDESKFVERFK